MKVRHNTGRHIEFNTDEVESGEFTFQNDEVWLAEYFANGLYSDNALAVAREPTSNCIDEVLHMINTCSAYRPWELHEPTEDEPYLQFTDYGRGMSYEFLSGTYVAFGGTTKDQTDEELGGFGMGSKAGLAFGGFTVTSIKDGLRSTITCLAVPGEVPKRYTVEKEIPTDEPNGTTVEIPVQLKDIPRVRDALSSNVLKYVPPKLQPKGYTSWLEGDTIRDLRKEGIPIIYDANSGDGNTSHVTFVLGFLPYVVPTSSFTSNMNEALTKIRSYIRRPTFVFPIGYLQVSVNRETLRLDDKVMARIEKHFVDIAGKVEDFFLKKVREAKTLKEAVEAATPLSRSRQSYRAPRLELNWQDPDKIDGPIHLSGRYGEILPTTENFKANDPQCIDPIHTEAYFVSSRSNAKWNLCITQGSNPGYTEESFTIKPDYPQYLIVLDKEKVKHWKVRLRYFWGSTVAADNGIDTSHVYENRHIFLKEAPTELLKKYPSYFKVIDLNDPMWEEPKVTKATRTKTYTDTALSFLQKAENNIVRQYIIKDTSPTAKKTLTYTSPSYQKFAIRFKELHSTDFTSLDDIGTVYFVPVRNGYKIDLGNGREIHTEYYEMNNIELNISSLFRSTKFFKEGDLLIRANASVRKQGWFKEMAASGKFVNVVRVCRRFIQAQQRNPNVPQVVSDALMTRYNGHRGNVLDREYNKDRYKEVMPESLVDTMISELEDINKEYDEYAEGMAKRKPYLPNALGNYLRRTIRPKKKQSGKSKFETDFTKYHNKYKKDLGIIEKIAYGLDIEIAKVYYDYLCGNLVRKDVS